MLGDRYVVTKGDNLWRIAARTLGSGGQWPRIWKYNNRPEIVRITGRSIPNPDRIWIGQLLLIPRLPGSPVSPYATNEKEGAYLATAAEAGRGVSSSPPSMMPRRGGSPSSGATPASLEEEARKVHLPAAFKYRLDTRWPPQDVGTAIIEVRMTGDVLLMSKRAYPATFITNRGEVEAQVTSEANHSFGKLVSDNRFIYHPTEKRVTLRSMLVSQSKTPNAAASAIGVEMSSNSPIPKLRAEIRLPKVEGSLNAFRYLALDVKFVVEITPKPSTPLPPTAQPKRHEVPVHVPAPRNPVDWKVVIGGGLVVVAGLIVVATIVEDFYTLGVGTADDAASFSAAGAALARGLVMLGAAGEALPKASSVASVSVTSKVALEGGI